MECSYINAHKRENFLFQFAVKYLHSAPEYFEKLTLKKKQKTQF